MRSVARFASSLETAICDPPWKAYVLAVGTVLTALLAREVLAAVFGINLFAILFLPAVVITGLACGLASGLFAAFLATFAPLIHIVGDNKQYFPNDANMVMNLIVIAALNVGLAIFAASHRTYRRRVELAARELNHRTKNLLTVMTGIANRLAQSSPDLDTFRAAFTERVRAMTIVNDLLARNEWKDTLLESAVHAAIAPFSAKDKIVVQGPELLVPPVIVENIMMALHELLTNSAKYGSLATDFGKIGISWNVINERMHFSWKGTGLQDSNPPSHKGFGTLMLTEVVPRNLGGHVQYEIKDGKVAWSVDFPYTSSTPEKPIGFAAFQAG